MSARIRVSLIVGSRCSKDSFKYLGVFLFLFLFFSHLSALLSSVLASLSGRFSHEEQDGGHQFSNPQTGSHWSGLGQGQSLTQSLWPEVPYWAMCSSLETGMGYSY